MATIQPQVRRPPDPIIREFLPRMRSLLSAWSAIARQVPDLQITSWYRSPTRNAATPGAAEFSQHTVGCAMDGISPALGQAKLYALAQSIAPRFGCTALASEGRAVHLQALPNGTVRQWASRNPGLYQSASAFVGPPRPVG